MLTDGQKRARIPRVGGRCRNSTCWRQMGRHKSHARAASPSLHSRDTGQVHTGCHTCQASGSNWAAQQPSLRSSSPRGRLPGLP